jgi:hypothetical protein
LSWNQVAQNFSSRTAIQCTHRWLKVLQPGLKKGKWSEEEDQILIQWVALNGPKNWNKLTCVINGRSSKQIRDRWINNLNPARGKLYWSDELDKLLLRKYLEYGSSWVNIAKHIPFSTENVVKNRFYSLLRSFANKFNKGKDKIKKNKDSGKLKKRNNYSLSYLLNFLPDLLEEKGIRCDSDSSTVYDDVIETPKPDILNKFTDEQKNFLVSFFESLSEKASQNSNENCKFKSVLMFNLQLAILSRILHKLKLQNFQRFFTCFRSNTLNA